MIEKKICYFGSIEKSELNIKMIKIYYILKELYTVHKILSASVRTLEDIYDTKMIISKNLKDIIKLLGEIRILVKGKYHHKNYFNNYVKNFQILVKQLNNNIADNIVIIMKLDTIIQKWYELHEIYYIQTKS